MATSNEQLTFLNGNSQHSSKTQAKCNSSIQLKTIDAASSRNEVIDVHLNDDVVVISSPKATEVPQNESFKLYKKRWFVLISMLIIDVAAGFVNWYVPIANILKSNLDMDQSTYNVMTLMSYMICILTIYPVTELVDKSGLKFSTYLLTSLFIVTYSIEAFCLSVTDMPKQSRFWLFIISELFAGLAMNLANSIVPKLVREWFSDEENTPVQMINVSAYLFGWSLTGLVPQLVESEQDLPQMSTIFWVISSTMGLATVATMTRSKPLTPPSKESLIAETASKAPRLDGIKQVAKRPKIVILILMYAFSGANFYFVILVLQNIMSTGGYSEKFCGLIVSTVYGFTIVSMNLSGYVTSKYKLYSTASISIAYAMSLLLFYTAILIANVQTLVVISSLLMSLTYSMSTASVIKDYFGSIVGLVPEPTAAALKNITFELVLIAMDLSTEPLRKANLIENVPSYAIPLGLFGITNLAINCASAFIK